MRSPLAAEAIGMLAQAAVFLVGLILSILIGMVLAKLLDGPGGLLIATIVSGAALLAAAALSQTVRDRLLESSL